MRLGVADHVVEGFRENFVRVNETQSARKNSEALAERTTANFFKLFDRAVPARQ